jgi:hypothetical protein
MRWLKLLIRILGWLLTPLMAWAACVLGAWLGLLIARWIKQPTDGLLLAAGAGVVAGFSALLLWMRLLRRSPKLRHTLHVTREGIPEPADVLALVHPEEAPPEHTE